MFLAFTGGCWPHPFHCLLSLLTWARNITTLSPRVLQQINFIAVLQRSPQISSDFSPQLEIFFLNKFFFFKKTHQSTSTGAKWKDLFFFYFNLFYFFLLWISSTFQTAEIIVKKNKTCSNLDIVTAPSLKERVSVKVFWVLGTEKNPSLLSFIYHMGVK